MQLTPAVAVAWLSLVAAFGCGAGPAASEPVSAASRAEEQAPPVPPVAPLPPVPPATAVSPPPAQAALPLGTAPAPTPADPKLVTKAQKLVQRGVAHYSRGEYDKAEEVLREAVLLYPFLPEANLVLGKIFLVRGSASRDRTMVSSARLMFEMAYALDPSLREAAVLLELFQAAANE